MHHNPIIRPIRVNESDQAKRLIYSVAHPLMEPQITLNELIARWESWGVLEEMNDILKNYFNCGGVFLVIEVDGCIVGTGAIRQFVEVEVFAEGGRLHTDDAQLRSGEGVCEVRRIALLPEYRGQKLGYLIMLDLIRRAREMGYNRMILWTDPTKLKRAVDFYHQLGFTDLAIDGIDPDELWMGIDL